MKIKFMIPVFALFSLVVFSGCFAPDEPPDDEVWYNDTMIMKSKYNFGEPINVTVKINETIYVGSDPWLLYKYQDGDWVLLNQGWLCAELCSEESTRCGAYIACAPAWSGCRVINIDQNWLWDQKTATLKTVQCRDYWSNETTDWNCMEIKDSGVGKYKLEFRYTTNCPVEDVWGKNATIYTIEKEFEIV